MSASSRADHPTLAAVSVVAVVFLNLLGFERALVPSAMAKDDGAMALAGFRTLGGFVDHMLGKG